MFWKTPGFSQKTIICLSLALLWVQVDMPAYLYAQIQKPGNIPSHPDLYPAWIYYQATNSFPLPRPKPKKNSYEEVAHLILGSFDYGNSHCYRKLSDSLAEVNNKEESR